jgi:alkanesulfonate monooxygenase SsuD/methylene tetrahydromethanopterin reductase-like flavin-dependent oxidoreductase (luciferase family)
MGQVSILGGALSPRMVRVAGETRRWRRHLAGLRSLADVIVPPVQAAAAGKQPRIVAARLVSVCDDIDLARAVAESVFARYQRLDNYRRLFDRRT